MGSPLRVGDCDALSRDAVSSPPSEVGRVRYAVIEWYVDRARVALLVHEARGGRSPTLAVAVLRGGSSKDDTVHTHKKWQVVARLQNKEGRPAKAEVCFPVGNGYYRTISLLPFSTWSPGALGAMRRPLRS